MIDITAVAASAMVCLAGVMSPGPNFVAVSHRAVNASRLEALSMVFGIALINTLWAALALFGLSAVLNALPWIFWTVKLFGSVYLVWFGIRLLMNSGAPLTARPPSTSGTSVRRALRDGLVTNLSNPKSMAFYASVFSSAVPENASSATLLAMIASVMALSTLWYGSIGLVLSGERAGVLYRKGKPGIERACGLFLIVFAGRQVLAG